MHGVYIDRFPTHVKHVYVHLISNHLRVYIDRFPTHVKHVYVHLISNHLRVYIKSVNIFIICVYLRRVIYVAWSFGTTDNQSKVAYDEICSDLSS
jgi:hypothetical protein